MCLFSCIFHRRKKNFHQFNVSQLFLHIWEEFACFWNNWTQTCQFRGLCCIHLIAIWGFLQLSGNQILCTKHCDSCCMLTLVFFTFSEKLGGCGLFGVGVWLSFTQAEFSSLPLSFPSLSAANLLLVAGGITMVTGFLGCLGALKEQRCLLFMVRGSYGKAVTCRLF